MENIHEPNDEFQFDKLTLSAPIFLNSGNYFIKYLYDNSPLYIQAPKCITKQGVIKGGKKMFTDLMFTNENESFIRWMESLENYSQKYIYENRAKWFENELEMHDIENSFTSPLKIYKSGKFYIVRTIIPTRLGKCVLKIYDEDEKELEIDSICDGTNVVSIWEIQGIKCSSKSFQIDIEIKQMMVIRPSNLFEKCLLKSGGSSSVLNTPIESPPSLGKIEEKEEENVKLEPMDQEMKLDSNESSYIENQIEPQNENESNGTTNDNGDNSSYRNIDNNIYSIGEDEEPDDESTVEVLEIDQDEFDDQEDLDKMVEIVDLDNTEINETADIELKDRNDMYYEIYMEAKKKAIESRNLAILDFLEAKRIRELYRIRDFLGDMEDMEDEDI